MKRYEDPKWVAGQAISLDFNYAMGEFVGEQGLNDAELAELTPRLVALDQELAESRQKGRLGFFELPYQEEILPEIRKVSRPILEWCWHLVVLGLGGSASGVWALHQALCHPQYNLFSLARRQHRPSLFVAENVDPDFLYGLLDGLELRRTAFNVISNQGETAETLAQFLWIYGLMQGRVGEEKARERLIVTTDAQRGIFRRLIAREGFSALSIPANVADGFSVLSAAGLLPASLVGIEVEELLAGARFMDQRLRGTGPRENLAYCLAALYYLFDSLRHRPILVIMPYGAALKGVADWFCQLWAQSLGKRFDLAGGLASPGTTPVSALGGSEPYSQVQLYLEGPQDKLIIFLEVENFQHHLKLPDLFPQEEDLSSLAGHTLNDLYRLEKQAIALHLLKAGRPNVTLRLPEVNAFAVGQLIYLLEVVTVVAAGLFQGKPFDQPGVEAIAETAQGWLGRPGSEAFPQQFAAPRPLREKYIIS